MNAGLRKAIRFAGIYGIRRTFFKVAGRLRLRIPVSIRSKAAADIAIIGCGQFGFSTIGYFLQRAFGPRMVACYDIDVRARESFARALRVPHVCASLEELLERKDVRTVYIASNHASHAQYAVAAIHRGLDVYVEKPIAVSEPQLIALLAALRGSRSRIFAGYNRPFSAAIRELRVRMRIEPSEGMSMQCFVTGHRLDADHWYRRPDEGTRVCGNLGHWFDLMIHVLAWRGLPDRLRISVSWADAREPDDNLSVTITSDRGDLFSVMLTSRSEPFEGISETISLQHGETICKIDDFRRMTLWQGPRLRTRRFWPKDVGHRLAVLQPFRQDAARDWQEIVSSTSLMLHIAEMVRTNRTESEFSLRESAKRLARELEQA